MKTPLRRALETIREVRHRTEANGSVWGAREILSTAEEDLKHANDELERASHHLYAIADELEARAKRLRQVADGLRGTEETVVRYRPSSIQYVEKVR